MPKRSTLGLTKRIVERLKADGKDAIFCDADLAGFGVRVLTTGRRLCIVQSWGLTGLKRVILGRVGTKTVDARRCEAAVVIDRIKRGADPPADADRVPAGRDAVAQMGRCRPRETGVAQPRRSVTSASVPIIPT